MYFPPWAFHMDTICCTDFDGCVYFSKDSIGLRPGPNDIIVTGRSFEEKEKTEAWCKKFGIANRIIYSQVPEHLKTREISGYHKAITLRELSKTYKIERFYEDDPIQWEILESMVPEIPIVHLVHSLTRK